MEFKIDFDSYFKELRMDFTSFDFAECLAKRYPDTAKAQKNLFQEVYQRQRHIQQVVESLIKQNVQLKMQNQVLQKQLSQLSTSRRQSPGYVFPNSIVRVSYSKDRKVNAVVRVKTSPNHCTTQVVTNPSSPRQCTRQNSIVTPLYLNENGQFQSNPLKSQSTSKTSTNTKYSVNQSVEDNHKKPRFLMEQQSRKNSRSREHAPSQNDRLKNLRENVLRVNIEELPNSRDTLLQESSVVLNQTPKQKVAPQQGIMMTHYRQLSKLSRHAYSNISNNNIRQVIVHKTQSNSSPTYKQGIIR